MPDQPSPISLADCQQRLQQPHLAAEERAYWLRQRATLLVAQDNYQDALYSYSRALELTPDDPMLLYQWGVVLHQLGSHDEAIAAYDRAREHGMIPTAQFWIDRGNTLARGLKRYRDALVSYDTALTLEPDNASGLSGQGFCLGMLGRTAQGLVSCDRALTLDPRLPEGWNSRGLVFYRAKRYSEALAQFDRALELQPNADRIWHIEAWCWCSCSVRRRRSRVLQPPSD
ncbi:MAG: tetratricopeptide repeat protein, partial [Leptolyngbyaceae cyanobacterium SL_7_1]|nr:tetratricopeptide repeat protein [Leptolyngbyaceae cyanobacterium SL_7_1]